MRLLFSAFVVLCMQMVLPVSIMGQTEEDEMVAVKTKKIIQSGDDNYLSTFALEFVEDSPVLEQFAARFLFNDSVSTTLIDAVNAYVRSLGDNELDEIPEILKEDNLFVLQLKTSHKGKYQCYNIAKRSKRTGQGISKEDIQQRNFIYDLTRKRILAISDVFEPNRAKLVEKQAKGVPIDMIMNDDTFVYTYKQNGIMLPELRIDYDQAPFFFTADFLKLIGKEPLQYVQNDCDSTRVYDVTERMPSFPGGDAALMKYLASHVKYPKDAEENGIQGRVICTFVVERDGSITGVRIVKSAQFLLDREAVRVLKNMPVWIPGTYKGMPVRVKYTVPVTFRLQ